MRDLLCCKISFVIRSSAQLGARVVCATMLHIRDDAMALAAVAAARPMNRNGVFSQFRHVDIMRLQFFFLFSPFHLDFRFDDGALCHAMPCPAQTHNSALFICTRSYDFISILFRFSLSLSLFLTLPLCSSLCSTFSHPNNVLRMRALIEMLRVMGSFLVQRNCGIPLIHFQNNARAYRVGLSQVEWIHAPAPRARLRGNSCTIKQFEFNRPNEIQTRRLP